MFSKLESKFLGLADIENSMFCNCGGAGDAEASTHGHQIPNQIAQETINQITGDDDSRPTLDE